MAKTDEDRILVCGAGPVGLTAALCLASYGCSVRIIDKNSGPTDLSKALTLWARTLELLDGAIDVSSFLEAGIKPHGACLHIKAREIGTVDWNNVPSRYGVGLFIPQSATERVLIDRLKEHDIEVERETEMLGFEDKGDHVDVTLRSSDGGESTCRTPWLIGCDGAHSSVRHQLDLDFSGTSQGERYVLADVLVDGNLKRDYVNVFFNEVGPIAFFPLGEGRYRLVTLTPDVDLEKGDPELEEIQGIIESRLGPNIRVSEPHWLASFRISDRVLDRFRVGRCFLAGDAAHIHSPVGGQGMNTGIQDVVNLAWKLAFHQRGLGSDVLLDSYSQERVVVAEKVVSSTKRMTAVLTNRNPVFRFVRETAVQIGIQAGAVQKFLGPALSMISINYRNVGIRGADAIPRHSGSLQSGDRIPYLPLATVDGGLVMLDSVCSGNQFTLLIIESPTTPSFEKAVSTMLGGISDRVQDLVDVVAVVASEASIPDQVRSFLDLEGEVGEKMGFRGHGAVLVRPDRYTALFMGALDATALEDWFNSL